MTREPTVFVIDGDPAARRSLTAAVESIDLEVEAYPSAEAFLDLCDPSQPGCLLVETRMPGIGGLELLSRLARENIHLPVIFISADGDVPTVVQAMKAGALNFLEKPCDDQQLREAVQEAIDWDAKNRRQLARITRIQRRLDRLTSGEREVLAMLVEGNSNKAMAAELGLSVRAIEVRRAKVMQKMKAQSLAELVRSTLLAKFARKGPESG